MKLLIYTTLILAGLLITYFIVKDYQTRMKEYNNYYCVEVYGLNPDCEVIK
jgi:hypothetical protein